MIYWPLMTLSLLMHWSEYFIAWIFISACFTDGREPWSLCADMLMDDFAVVELTCTQV
jgi:hypothetical protein